MADTIYQTTVLARARRRKFNQRKKTIAVFTLSVFILVAVVVINTVVIVIARITRLLCEARGKANQHTGNG